MTTAAKSVPLLKDLTSVPINWRRGLRVSIGVCAAQARLEAVPAQVVELCQRVDATASHVHPEVTHRHCEAEYAQQLPLNSVRGAFFKSRRNLHISTFSL